MTHEEDIKRLLKNAGEVKEIGSTSITSKLAKEITIITKNNNKLFIQIYRNEFEVDELSNPATFSLVVKLEIDEGHNEIVKRNILNIQSTENIIETIETNVQSLVTMIITQIAQLDAMLAAATEVQNFIDENS